MTNQLRHGDSGAAAGQRVEISNEGRVVRELEKQLKHRADRARGDDTE